ncbi:ATP-binding protein [Sphingomonas sp. BT-65]|uniref:AlbA family DNA-binding domain-containing protein n=1 Tax=Sphingomonas sp. BT-65 TaxID=2989821 RepID=UPI002235A229|nr:ATP-binding protein [Sphingomonas sp. BT-65]MCW4461109.1 ATP-binding protein [Sphingomonas sp. BT-65]
MDIEHLKDLISGGESQIVEFKSAIPKTADDLATEIAAFSTSDGGYLFIGVADDGKIMGLGAQDATSRTSLKRLEGIAQSVQPAPTYNAEYVTIDGVTILAVRIEKGSEPVYYAKSKPMHRRQTSSTVAPPDLVKSLVLRWDAIIRASKLSEQIEDGNFIAGAILGQGELATMNKRDIVDHLRRLERQRLA